MPRKSKTPPSPQPVVIGMDPHKRSVTIEVMTGDETVLTGGRFTTDETGFAAMLAFVERFPDRVWAIEGCPGIGRHVAVRLVCASEKVVDVPARLAHRVRLVTSGNGRKTDPADAHPIAIVGGRTAGLRPVVNNEQLELLRVLIDRRQMLGQEHTRKISQVHRLLLELVPGGAKAYLSAKQAREILAGVRPKDPAGKARKALAMELVKDLEQVHQRTKDADRQLAAALNDTGTTLPTCTESVRVARRSCWSRSVTSPVSRIVTTSRPGPGQHRSTPHRENMCATGSRARATDR